MSVYAGKWSPVHSSMANSAHTRRIIDNIPSDTFPKLAQLLSKYQILLAGSFKRYELNGFDIGLQQV